MADFDLLVCVCLVLFSCLIGTITSNADISDGGNQDSYEIEGKVFPPENLGSDVNWQAETTVVLKGGYHVGFLREDGSFIISNIPSGSYVIEVINPNYSYEPVRVEINSKGKFRARKVNYIQTSQVIQVPYPLKMKPLGPAHYFQLREQWRATDFLFSPMVLMMVLPLIVFMLLSWMSNDPESRKEMEHFNNLTKYDMPEMSEVITSFFGGGGGGGGDKQKPKALKSSKKGNKNTS